MKKNGTAAEAFGAFAKKFLKSSQYNDNSKPNIVYEDDIIQRKINAKEDDYKALIISSYSKYLNPFRVLGKNSPLAQAIDTDEKNLLKAYNLFKAVHDANLSIGDTNTFVKIPDIHSPLTNRDCYTSGGEFIYLQCWLMFAQNIKDFIPELVAVEENFQTHYVLQFSQTKNYGWSFQDKEVLAAIQSAYSA